MVFDFAIVPRMKEATYEEVLNLAASPCLWDARQVRISKKKFKVTRPSDSMGKVTINFEKKSNKLRGELLEIEVFAGDSQTFYWVAMPWDLAERLAEFIQDGPWVPPQSK